MSLPPINLRKLYIRLPSREQSPIITLDIRREGLGIQMLVRIIHSSGLHPVLQLVLRLRCISCIYLIHGVEIVHIHLSHSCKLCILPRHYTARHGELLVLQCQCLLEACLHCRVVGVGLEAAGRGRLLCAFVLIVGMIEEVVV